MFICIAVEFTGLVPGFVAEDEDEDPWTSVLKAINRLVEQRVCTGEHVKDKSREMTHESNIDRHNTKEEADK